MPVYDLIIGNIKGARPPQDPDASWSPPQMHKPGTVEDGRSDLQEGSAVETRAMKTKRMAPTRPLKVPSMIDVDKTEFLEAQKTDDSITHLWEKAKSNLATGKYEFFIRNKILRRRYRSNGDEKSTGTGSQVVVPKSRRNDVMKLAHDGVMAGHQGIRKTYERASTHFYWPNMHYDVTLFCRSCDNCQRTLPKGKVGVVPLGKLPLIEEPFKRVAMDLVGPIHRPSDSGKRYLLTLIDYATRYPEAIPLSNIDTETVAEALVDVYSRVGIPSEVLTDQGTQFVSDVMQEVSRLLSIKRLVATPYHPIANGAVEKFNGTLKLMLKRMCAERPRDWDRYVNPLLFAYREIPNDSLKFLPFELLFGREVRGPMSILRSLWTKDEENSEVKTTYQYVLDLKERLRETCKMAHDMLGKSQEKYKKYYEQKN